MGAFIWKIEKIVSKGDYNYAVVRDHPSATRRGCVLEHRVVMENHLGRLLESCEIVHHKSLQQKKNRAHSMGGRARLSFCSRSCSGSWWGSKPTTDEVESAVSGNIVREYRVYKHDNPEVTE